MQRHVSHKGIVEAVDHGVVRVRIVQTSACAACAVHDHCAASDQKEKIVEVSAEGLALRVGQEVSVRASQRVAALALTIAFGVPLVLMLCALALTFSLTGNEAWSGVAAVGVLLPYYIGIRLMHHRLDSEVAFEIEE